MLPHDTFRQRREGDRCRRSPPPFGAREWAVNTRLVPFHSLVRIVRDHSALPDPELPPRARARIVRLEALPSDPRVSRQFSGKAQPPLTTSTWLVPTCWPPGVVTRQLPTQKSNRR